MQRLCLTLARLFLSAWIGAAALFVCTSVSEQMSPTIGSDVKNSLAAIRFPWYYGFGFGLVGAGFVSSVCGISWARQRVRWTIVAASLVLTLILMAVDYVAIYTPLRAIVTDPSGVREARFIELHRWSERINALYLSTCLIAALSVCWPAKHSLTPNP